MNTLDESQLRIAAEMWHGALSVCSIVFSRRYLEPPPHLGQLHWARPKPQKRIGILFCYCSTFFSEN